jgi:hypothetical protein
MAGRPRSSNTKDAIQARAYRKTEKGKAVFAKYRASAKYTQTRRNTWYKNKYHVTFAEFEAQLKEQNYLCPIGNHPFGPIGRGGDSPCLDHNHETGENRGIICSDHNLGLGKFHDSAVEVNFAL